ncbi:hypothetical protein [uncultured Roseibium sp.]|uniref:TipJ family phage tail tip protein n=1 Tax=uncultured Roseibium sp. TaxID=1936171 RepID=UPI003217BBD7
MRTPVSVIPAIGPDAGRLDLEAPEGLSVAAIVDLALPGVPQTVRDRARVWLVDNRGEMLLPDPRAWHRITPKAGVRVMIRIVPGGDTVRNVLLIAVSIAAIAIGQVWVGPLIAGLTGSALLGQVAAGVAAAGLGILGSFLVNALIPPSAPRANAGQELQAEKPLYQISGWRNQMAPDGVVPSLLGKVRVAPVFAAPSYSEIVGDDQYVRALLNFGYGPVSLSGMKIGETPIESFDEVQTEIREGYASDEPVTIYPSQVIEESLGIELRRDRLRDDAGVVIGDGPMTPTSRFTAGDCAEVNLIWHFPGGLIHYDGEGNAQSRSVAIRIRQRPASGGDWQELPTITFTAKKREGFFRQFRWTLPSRGRWEIELARGTDESLDANTSDRVNWLAMQSFRPEYPLNFDKPLCLVAIRVKATYQLNSSLDTFNAVAERVLPDWDHATQRWVTRATRNPASHYRHVLQGPENTWPEPDSAIDLEALQDWHDFCRVKGLKYDRDRNFEASTWDALTEIAGAGRAAPRYDGTKWSVVIDRPQALVVAHINSRNSRDFSWSRNYIEPPDAFRVRFLDETADYQQRERVVRWPGFTGDIDVTEELQLPGKTDPDEVWIEARRRQYEVIYRPDVFSAVQDGAVRTATRGDFVKASYEVLKNTLAALKVTAVRGQAVTLDGYVEMGAGVNYAVRFMKQVGTGDDATFESVLRSIRTVPGRTDTIILAGGGDLPVRGDLIQFGPAGEESIDLVISGVQAGEQMTNVISMLAQAPEIDTLTDADVPPAWNGRAGGDATGEHCCSEYPGRVVDRDPFRGRCRRRIDRAVGAGRRRVGGDVHDPAPDRRRNRLVGDHRSRRVWSDHRYRLCGRRHGRNAAQGNQRRGVFKRLVDQLCRNRCRQYGDASAGGYHRIGHGRYRRGGLHHVHAGRSVDRGNSADLFRKFGWLVTVRDRHFRRICERELHAHGNRAGWQLVLLRRNTHRRGGRLRWRSRSVRQRFFKGVLNDRSERNDQPASRIDHR